MIKEQQRMEFIDTLRGISILLVLVYHFFYIFYRNKENKYQLYSLVEFIVSNINIGIMGVFIFFLISGFVISLTLKEYQDKEYYIEFAIKRFFRIIPAYWFAIFFSIAIYTFFQIKSYDNLTILANLSMTQDLFHKSYIDGVFWTLIIEMKFYLIVIFLGIIGLWHFKNTITLLFAVFSFLVMFYGLYTGKYLGAGFWVYIWAMFIGTILLKNRSKLFYINIFLFLTYIASSILIIRTTNYFQNGFAESWLGG